MGSGGAYEIWYDGYANFGGEYDYPANVTASDVLTRFVTWQNSWSSSYKPNACEVVNKKLRSYNVFGGEYNTRYSYHWDAIGTLIKFAIPVAPFSSITMTIENYSLDCSWSLEDRELCGACRAKSLSRCIRLAGIDTVPANSSNTPHVAAVPSYSSLSAPLKVPSYASDMDLRENYGYGITPSVNKVTIDLSQVEYKYVSPFIYFAESNGNTEDEYDIVDAAFIDYRIVEIYGTIKS